MCSFYKLPKALVFVQSVSFYKLAQSALGRVRGVLSEATGGRGGSFSYGSVAPEEECCGNAEASGGRASTGCLFETSLKKQLLQVGTGDRANVLSSTPQHTVLTRGAHLEFAAPPLRNSRAALSF